LTVLERGQQYKRLKAFHEVKYPETKNGGDRKSDEIRSRIPASDSVAFVKDIAAKTNHFEKCLLITDKTH
jgi:hypothetical protein